MHLLTLPTLTKQFTLLLSQRIPDEKKFNSSNLVKRQLHVDVALSKNTLEHSLDRVCKEKLIPAVDALVMAIEPDENISYEMLDLPVDIMADRERYDGVAVRGVMSKENEMDFIRFDITTV